MAACNHKNGANDQVITRVFEATRQLYLAIGVDLFLGRKLPSILQDLNLQAVNAKAAVELLQGGSTRAKIWRMAVEHLRSRLLATKIPSEEDLHQFTHLMQDPRVWALDYTMVSAWGQKEY
jgi:hypothetical protein